MIFFVHRKARVAWVCFLVLLGMLISSICFFRAEETKADKSNAMQVVSRADAEASAKIDFFTEYRLERDRLRSERSELLRERIKSADTEESRQAAQETILKLMQEREREAEMESLIKAKGFADALVFAQENASVSAVVKASVLTGDEVVQVADIISRVGGVRPEDITISAKP